MNDVKTEVFIFREVPSMKEKLIAFLISFGIVALLFFYFPYLPNFRYLKQVMPIVQEELGVVLPIFLIILFYSMFIIVFYQIIITFFAKKVFLEIMEDGSVQIIIGLNEENYKVSQSVFEFKKRQIIIHLPNKKLVLRNHNYKEPNYNAFKSALEANQKYDRNDGVIVFRGYISQIKKQIRTLIILIPTILLFGVINYYYDIYIINNHEEILSLLFRSKGMLLMFVIRIPLIFLLLALVLMAISYNNNFNSVITVKFEKNSIFITNNKKQFRINKKDIQNSIFSTSTGKNHIDKLLIKLKNRKSHVLLSKSDSFNFNLFLNYYKKFNDIKEEDYKNKEYS